MTKNPDVKAKHKYLLDKEGKPIDVCLPIEEYQNIMNILENHLDAKEADEAFEEIAQGRSLPEIIDDLLHQKK